MAMARTSDAFFRFLENNAWRQPDWLYKKLWKFGYYLPFWRPQHKRFAPLFSGVWWHR